MAEVVQTLNRIKAEGVLRIASQQGTRDVVFGTGEIVGVANRDGGEHRLILRRLALMGLVRPPTSEELQQAEAMIASLLELGTVSQDQVLDLIHDQALETLYDLNTWTSADFLFHEATEEDEFKNAVARHRQNGLAINVNSVLMEAARRHDEWEIIREIFHDHNVPRIVPGHEEETGKHRAEFPGILLVPLVDGTHAIEEIIEDTGLTRFSVFSTLAVMQKEGSLRLMTPDELHDEAERLALDGQQADAARVFRHILAAKPEDSAAVTALASCLADLGDMGEAAECHAQLALSHLTRERFDDALEDATRAVELEETDPDHRGILVRCLVQLDRLDEAADHLVIQAQQYEQAGLMEEARDTWRKVLELRPGDDSTRHNLAAIQVKQGGGSGDVVVCLECGTVNPRERDECLSCQAKLRLGCMVCGKSVSIGDRICIFCGANPHLPADQQGPLKAGPTTERIAASAKPSTEAKQKGSARWRAELHAQLERARDLEEAGKLEEALDQWRELARAQQNNTDLTKHIRDLEGLLHDRYVERAIARGHDLRRSRKYGRALKAYRAALRGMGEDDIRGARLREIITATGRSNRRILAIYSLAFVVIVATGILAVKPYYDVSTVRSVAAKIETRLDGHLLDLPTVRVAMTDLSRIEALAENLRGGHRSRADEALARAHGSVRQARVATLETAFAAAKERLDARDVDGAVNRLAGLDDLFDEHYQNRQREFERDLAALRTALQAEAAAVAAAPARLAAAVEVEAAGRLGEALAEYRALAALGDASVTAEAEAAVERLGALESTFHARVRGVGTLAGQDLTKAQSELTTLANDAKRWGMEEAYATLVEELAARRRAATARWEPLAAGADIAALEAFVTEHGAAPEGALARARLAQARTNARQREATLERYRKAVADREFDIAWQLATTLHQQFPGRISPGEAPFPLQLVTSPAGAEVVRAGKVIGVTPHVIAYDSAQASEPIVLRAVGFEDATVIPAQVGQWQLNIGLVRAVRWQTTPGVAARVVVAGADGHALVVGNDVVQAVSLADGRRLWRASLGESDPMIPRNTPVMPPVRLRDGSMVVAGVGTSVAVIAPDGTVRTRHPLVGALRAKPMLFTNDLLGGDQRLALVCTNLLTGPVLGRLTPVRLPEDTLSGTVAIRGDLDRILIAADLLGRLVAVEESSGNMIWTEDLGGAEVGAFIPVGSDHIAFLLDGSRLVCWQLAAKRGQEAWSRSLGGQPIGQPVVSGNRILVALTDRVLVTEIGGAELPAITLPSPAQVGVQVADGGRTDIAAIGCAQHLVVIAEGVIAWSTPVASPVVAVGFAGDMILAALEDGSLLAYQL